MNAGILTLLSLLVGPGATPSDVWTMRDRHLQIPIRINDAKRNDLVELVLYVSADQGRSWTGAGKAKPTQDAFNFHADKDGMYWFSVQAIDRDGKYDPPDIAQVPPALKVLIDTQKPLVQIVSAERSGDEIVVAWQTLEAQADANSLKIEYRPSDGSSSFWQMAPATPALSGQARFRPNIAGPVTVRLQMMDAMGVPATVTKEVPAATPNLQQSNSVTPPPPMMPPSTPIVAPIMTPSDQPVPQAAPPVAATVVTPPPPAPTQPPTAPVPASTEPLPSAGNLAPLAGLRSGEEAPKKPAVAPPPDFQNHAHGLPRAGATEIQHVRDKQVGLDFEIERRGPSGIKKMETYITPDDGQTWYKWSETAETTSPLQLALPEKEGVYGFRMVVYSGVMQTDGPPKSGAAPDLRVQVDRTLPQVEWYPPSLDANVPNALTLRFALHDAHLDANSMTLQWSRQAEGGWQSIALSNLRAATIAGQPHLKECTWLLPADVPDSVFLRITARDLAGNVGERITRDPVTVDLHKPTARLKRIVPATSTSSFRP